MGNTTSGANYEDLDYDGLKDRVFGTVLLMISDDHNPDVNYKNLEECIGDENALPLSDGDNDYERGYNYHNDETELIISNYVNQHILSDKEKTRQFFKTLVDRLATPESTVASSTDAEHLDAVERDKSVEETA